jgi:FAD binding domain
MLRSGMPDTPLQVSRISKEALRSQDMAIAAAATVPNGAPYIGKERAACDVAIVGTGPHGLATAAHLRAAGVDVRVFGEVMGSWRHNMPAGMVLRSERLGSHIPDPARDLTLEQFEAAIGRQLPRR